jgi:hypothetical protein
MELRSLFNQLDLVDRAIGLNYTASWLSWRQGSQELENRFGKPFVSAVLRFSSPEESVVFDVHAYLAFDLSLMGISQLLDPKSIYLLGRVRFFTPGGAAQ